MARKGFGIANIDQAQDHLQRIDKLASRNRSTPDAEAQYARGFPPLMRLHKSWYLLLGKPA